MSLNLLPGADCILMYHGTPASDAARLERQLRALALVFDVVPLAELAREAGGRRRRVALTFDDGLRNNVAVAYPILRKLGLPATFFVCPGLVDSGRWLWNHEARERLRVLPAPALAELAAAVGAPAEREAFVDWMKTLKLAERRRVEAEIRAATPGFRPNAEQRSACDIAPWPALKALDPRTVSVGSHTMTHPILTSLERDELEHEIGESRAALETELGREVADFCYPNGDLDEQAVDAARRHYRRAVTVDSGSLGGDVDPYLLPRFAAQPHATLRLARRLAFG